MVNITRGVVEVYSLSFPFPDHLGGWGAIGHTGQSVDAFSEDEVHGGAMRSTWSSVKGSVGEW